MSEENTPREEISAAEKLLQKYIKEDEEEKKDAAEKEIEEYIGHDYSNLMPELPDDPEEAEKIIYQSMLGYDNENQSKVSLTLTSFKINGITKKDIEDPKKREILSEYSIRRPSIKITPTKGFIMLDLIFKSALDPELSIIYNHLEKHGQLMDSLAQSEEKSIPVCVITLIPTDFYGKYYYSLIDPIFWCKQPSTSLKMDNNSIRLLFVNDQEHFFISDEADFDINTEMENLYRAEIEEKKKEENN